MAGLAVAGALTSALRLITKAAFEKSNDRLRKGASKLSIVMENTYISSVLKIHLLCFLFFSLCAVIFLAISTFIEFLCVMLYAYVFPKLPIVNYYRQKAALEGSQTVAADLAAAGIQYQSNWVISDSSRITTFFYKILKKIYLDNYFLNNEIIFLYLFQDSVI